MGAGAVSFHPKKPQLFGSVPLAVSSVDGGQVRAQLADFRERSEELRQGGASDVVNP